MKWLFLGFVGVTLLSTVGAVSLEEPLLFGLPFLLLLILQTVLNYERVFFLLMFCLPLSTEYFFDNGLATDLPTEPIVVGLMLAYLAHLSLNWKVLGGDFVRHPIVWVLFLHLLWIVLTVINAQDIVVSVKWLLAKIWYVVVYFFLAASILKSEKSINKLTWIILLPLSFAIVSVLVRHAAYGFSFNDVKYVMQPFFRNHVLYAAIMAIFLPYIFFALYRYKRYSTKWWFLLACVVLFLVGIQLSYTRTAYVALMLAVGSYFIIKMKLIKYAIGISLIIATFVIANVLENNKYLDYAPNYERTITHHKFDNLVEATYKMEDVSTMERVYRWVAGLQMHREAIWLGFGPGNFYNHYRGYAVDDFETYISDNEDKSGIHNYYLMTLVEQGILGAVIFLLLTCYVLIRGEQLYHRLHAPSHKRIVMTVLLSTIMIDAFLLINDMVETDKVGAFFFMNMAILINIDLWSRKGSNATLN